MISHDYNVFLAHEDIEPSTEWQEEIIKNLRACDIFIPVMSENFKQSEWTDQESGFALALDKLIIPIDLGIVPYGFIGKYQALKLKENVHDSCKKIIDIIRTRPKFKEILDNKFINEFVNSGSFSEANGLAKSLEQLEPFTSAQINEIIRGYMSNDQLQGAFRAKRKINSWFTKYKDSIQSILVEQFNILLMKNEDEQKLAIEKIVYEFLKSNGSSTILEIMRHFALQWPYIERALSQLEKEGKVKSEIKMIEGKESEVYSLETI